MTSNQVLLVVSVLVQALSILSALAFAFLPTVFDPNALLGRLIFGCLVLLVVWVSIGMIRQSRLAWFIGAAVFFPLAVSGLLALGILIQQKISPGKPEDALPLGTVLVCFPNAVAYLVAYAKPGVRQLFRRSVTGDAASSDAELALETERQ